VPDQCLILSVTLKILLQTTTPLPCETSEVVFFEHIARFVQTKAMKRFISGEQD
jgi:hypothetical protein